MEPPRRWGAIAGDPLRRPPPHRLLDHPYEAVLAIVAFGDQRFQDPADVAVALMPFPAFSKSAFRPGISLAGKQHRGKFVQVP